MIVVMYICIHELLYITLCNTLLGPIILHIHLIVFKSCKYLLRANHVLNNFFTVNIHLNGNNKENKNKTLTTVLLLPVDNASAARQCASTTLST